MEGVERERLSGRPECGPSRPLPNAESINHTELMYQCLSDQLSTQLNNISMHKATRRAFCNEFMPVFVAIWPTPGRAGLGRGSIASNAVATEPCFTGCEYLQGHRWRAPDEARGHPVHAEVRVVNLLEPAPAPDCLRPEVPARRELRVPAVLSKALRCRQSCGLSATAGGSRTASATEAGRDRHVLESLPRGLAGAGQRSERRR